MSFGKDLIALFLTPVRLYESVREHPRCRWAVILILVVLFLATFLTLDILIQEGMRRGAEQAAERGMDAARMAEMADHPAAKISILLATPVGLIVFLLGFSAAAWLFLALTGGAPEPKPFAALFRAAAWAKLVEIPRMILWTPLTLAKGTPMVFFGPAALLRGAPEGKLFTALAALDLFSIWYLVLFTVGARTLLRISTGRAAVVVILPWALWQGVRVFLA
ncbi:MAG: YIP1 family protein [Candidatus Eisenbacteria bacterium]|nr:YIP1 family protein [Candidatus Eisenbacteria bacterium]